MESVRVSFGKYKGQSIETMARDKSYVEWCKKQALFQSTPECFILSSNATLVLKEPVKDAPTPIHNEMQLAFLEPEFAKRFFFHFWLIGRVSRLPTNVSTELEAAGGWDVVFRGDILSLFVEIKPLLGDDWPCVLRKLRSQPSKCSSYYNCVLYVRDFKASNCSRDQLRAAFGQIDVLFEDELKSWPELKSKILNKLMRQILPEKEIIANWDSLDFCPWCRAHSQGWCRNRDETCPKFRGVDCKKCKDLYIEGEIARFREIEISMNKFDKEM